MLVLEVEVAAEVDVDFEVDVVEEEEEEEVEEDDDDDVVAAPPGLPIMAAEATAGPVVLIEATEVPLGNGKKFESALSQQTFDAFRL